MTNTIDTVRDQLGEHLRYAMIHGAASISLERLSCWAGILSRHIEQQPEQGAEGQPRSDESDVQSAAAIIAELRARANHEITVWQKRYALNNSLGNKEAASFDAGSVNANFRFIEWLDELSGCD